MPLRKARKLIFRSVFARERGKENSDKLLEILCGGSFKNRLLYIAAARSTACSATAKNFRGFARLYSIRFPVLLWKHCRLLSAA